MIRLELGFDDLRKIGTMLRKPEVSLTECAHVPTGAMRVSVLADVAKLAELGRFVDSLKVTIVLELGFGILDKGRVEVRLLDLSLEKSQAPLLARPFLRPNTFRKTLFDQLGKQPNVIVDREAGTIIFDLNDNPRLKQLGLGVVLAELEVGPDGVVVGLTLEERSVQ